MFGFTPSPISFLTKLHLSLQNRSKGDGKRGKSVRHSFNSRAGSISSPASSAFTIVELLIVIVVIGILATITVVAYSNITNQAATSSLKADLHNAAKQLGVLNVDDGSYPSPNLPDSITASSGNDFTYTSDGTTYCLTVTSLTNTTIPAYHITNGASLEEGACEGHGDEEDSPLYMQTITTENCPTTRTVAVDARDNHTYWVQKLADNKCWMLTNLAYAGGTSNDGVDTYGDTKVINNGTDDSATTYTEAKYYIHEHANPTQYPSEPSTSTDGGTTNPQYGYLYNWCAAMGAQAEACKNDTGTGFTSASICPSGWRLPTGEATTGDFALLNNVANSGLANTDQGLRENWLAQRGGYWQTGFSNLGTGGSYWSATQTLTVSASSLHFSYNFINSAGNATKIRGQSVRCVAI